MCLSTLATTSVRALARGGARTRRGGSSCTCSRTAGSAASSSRGRSTHGYEALVVTVDLPVRGVRERELRSEAESVAAELVASPYAAGAEPRDLMTPGDVAALVDPTLSWSGRRADRRRQPAAGDRQGDPDARGCTARRRARRARRGRLQPRRPPARHGARGRRRAARRSSMRSAVGSRCSSTAASAAAPTCSRRSRSARARCWSGARRCGDLRSPARRRRSGCSRSCLREFDAALALAGVPRAARARPKLLDRAGRHAR